MLLNEELSKELINDLQHAMKSGYITKINLPHVEFHPGYWMKRRQVMEFIRTKYRVQVQESHARHYTIIIVDNR